MQTLKMSKRFQNYVMKMSNLTTFIYSTDYSDQLPMPTTNSNAMTVVEPTFQFKVENIEKEIVSRTKTSIESPMPAKGLSPAGMSFNLVFKNIQILLIVLYKIPEIHF